MKGIADTGFLVAFANRSDRHHTWAVSLAGALTQPLLTCEAVLAETAFHLRSVPVVMEMLRENLITLYFDLSENLAQIETLARQYSDQQPDLADLCLIRMSELNPRHSVVTTDYRDFSVYRRNKREKIPLVSP